MAAAATLTEYNDNDVSDEPSEKLSEEASDDETDSNDGTESSRQGTDEPAEDVQLAEVDGASAIKYADLEELFENVVEIPDDNDDDTDTTDANTEHATLLNSTGRTAFSESSAERSRAKRKLGTFQAWVVIASRHKTWVLKNAK